MTTSRFFFFIALFCLALFAVSCQKEALTEPTLPAKLQRIEQSDELSTNKRIKPNTSKNTGSGVMTDPYSEELPNGSADIRFKRNNTGVSADPHSEELPNSYGDIRPKL